MASLHVRNVDQDLVLRLKKRAARHGRSAEAEHREILRQALLGESRASFDDLAAQMFLAVWQIARRQTTLRGWQVCAVYNDIESNTWWNASAGCGQLYWEPTTELFLQPVS